MEMGRWTWREYVDALEEEHRKIQFFRRELPLCLDLVNQTIENYKRRMESELLVAKRLELEEESTPGKDEFLLEEFIPPKTHDDHMTARNSGNDDDDEEEKSDWLRSVRLWSQHSDPSKEDTQPRKLIEIDAKKATGAFRPFNKEIHAPEVRNVAVPTTTSTAPPLPEPAMTTATSTADAGSGDGGGGCAVSGVYEEKEGLSHRKGRRCWTTELHRQFLHALRQLGGAYVATPKQIREIMKVDGLTNDEIKSHLQKYRLHTRKPSPTVQANESHSQTPKFVPVRGIWVPPEFAAAAAAAVAASTQLLAEGCQPPPEGGIYAPKASVPLQTQCMKLGASNGNSPTSSASSHTTTTTDH